MTQEQPPNDGPAVSVDGEEIREKAGEKRKLSDHLHRAAGAMTVITAAMAVRNPGSLFATAQQMCGQIVSQGTRLLAGRLATSAATSEMAVDGPFTETEVQGMSGLDEVEGTRFA